MYSTEGFILKSMSLGESDAFFSIYTKDFGKMRARAQGVRKEEAKLKGHLEPLNLTVIGFVLGRHGERLTHAGVMKSWPVIRSDWERLHQAYKVVNLVDQYCFEGERDAALWHLLVASFAALEDEKESARIREAFFPEFQKRFLECLGYDGMTDISSLPAQFERN